MRYKELSAEERKTSSSTHPFPVEGVQGCDRVQAVSEGSCAVQVVTIAGTMDKRCLGTLDLQGPCEEMGYCSW